MALDQRIARIERRLLSPRAGFDKEFWSAKLKLLTDEQLARLEELYLKICGEVEDGNAQEHMTWEDAAKHLDAGEQRELEAIFAVMDRYPEDFSL